MSSSGEWRAIWRALLGALGEELRIANTVGMQDVLQATDAGAPHLADPGTGEEEERRCARALHDENQLANDSGILGGQIAPGLSFAGNSRETFALQVTRRQAHNLLLSATHL